MSEMPTKRIRDFEKGVLRGIYDDLCEPGNHHKECPRGSNACPHRGKENE